MFILDKPFVSDFLIETAFKNGYPVLQNAMAAEFELCNKLNLVPETKAISLVQEGEKLYSNSENAIDWITKNLGYTEIPSKINLFKDKAKFRRLISEIYPDFYFKEVSIDNLKTLDISSIPFPVVLKPTVGFLSFGVYTILNAEDWQKALKVLNSDIEKYKSVFPSTVVDSSNFIIEKMIEGEEFAIDAYFNDDFEPVILNIYKHPFKDGKDVSDRAYYTSKNIIKTHLEDFYALLSKINKHAKLKNFPMHIELRVNKDEIIPIEVNPMRFAGWCISDLAYFAWGINVYEYYFNSIKPDWEKVLDKADDSFYYFTVAETPAKAKKTGKINYEKFMENFSNPLEIRKFDPKKFPVFAIVFAKTGKYDEISEILNLKLDAF